MCKSNWNRFCSDNDREIERPRRPALVTRWEERERGAGLSLGGHHAVQEDTSVRQHLAFIPTPLRPQPLPSPSPPPPTAYKFKFQRARRPSPAVCWPHCPLLLLDRVEGMLGGEGGSQAHTHTGKAPRSSRRKRRVGGGRIVNRVRELGPPP